MPEWNQQVCVITGAASGIGAGLARHAAKLGMALELADIDTRNLESLCESLRAAGAVAESHKLDVRQGDAFEEWAKDVFSRHSQVNLFFNNAGVLVDGKSWERSEADWRWNLDVNIMGVVNGIRAFVPLMLTQNAEGRVINTSSIGGLVGGGQFMGPYQGSKHAVAAITETLHQELKLEAAPISASCLCPGEVDTGIWESDRLREGNNELHSTEEQEFHDFVAGMVADGLSPDEFAARVWQGIDAEKFWIFPQSDFKSMYQARAESVINETSPLTMAEMMGGK